MKKYNKIKPFILAFLVFSSCNDDILKKENPSQLPSEAFFSTQTQAESAVNAIYAGLQANQMYNREFFFVHDLLSDDMASGGAQLEAPRAAVLNHILDANNPLINAVWTGLYRVIHRANLVISRISDVPDVEITSEMRNRLEGEARFLRAWAYFELVSLWGPIPLIKEPAATTEGFPRLPESDVYILIFEDLAFAEGNLPLKSEYGGGDLGRATKGAAQALAGRIRLFRGEYAEAKTELQKVIDSNQYSLVSRYLDNFQEENENNSESIWEIQLSEEYGTSGAWNGDGRGIAEITFRGQEYGPNAWRNIIPSPDLVAAYDENDPRKEYSFFQIGDSFNNGTDVLTTGNVAGGATTPSWEKYQMIYKRASENQSSGINFRNIRYADVLLMMAEIQNELIGPDASIGYVNQVRARGSEALAADPEFEGAVNLPPLPEPSNKEEMFDIIVHERRVELAGEQIRNRDIRRWRRAGKLDSEPIDAYQAHHDLLPIPAVEIDNNSSLTGADQNSGY